MERKEHRAEQNQQKQYAIRTSPNCDMTQMTSPSDSEWSRFPTYTQGDFAYSWCHEADVPAIPRFNSSSLIFSISRIEFMVATAFYCHQFDLVVSFINCNGTHPTSSSFMFLLEKSRWRIGGQTLRSQRSTLTCFALPPRSARQPDHSTTTHQNPGFFRFDSRSIQRQISFFVLCYCCIKF